MATSIIGRMHEQTFNEALANELRGRRRAWRENQDCIVSERQGVVINAEAERPDILISPPDIYPVIIEVEFGGPATQDARKRLGRQVAGTNLPVRSAIAVGAPDEIRQWSNQQLREKLAHPDGVALQYVVLSAFIRGDENYVKIEEKDVQYWPTNGHVVGTVNDLADLCEYAAAPPMLVSRMADEVSIEIKNHAKYLHQALPSDVANEIASRLGQKDSEQGLRLACCIWLTSLRLHDMLATKSSSLRSKGLKTIGQLRTSKSGRVVVAGDLKEEWDKILSVNYGAIFHTSLSALDDQIPTEVISNVLTSLARLAERITSLRLGNRVDFAGELFPLLLDDREETAAHYTLPETAELLARLAVDRIAIGDWANAELVDNLRVADLSCGTGSLLRSSYGHIRRRHESAGGTAQDLHRSMMEKSLTGLDINSLASHMTAAGLSATEMETEYFRTNIAAVSVFDGRTGSLELMQSDQITDVTGQQARTATSSRAEPVVIGVPSLSQDLVIQNPPYSRARGERKLFDVTGIDEEQRQRSLKRLGNIRARLRRNGDAMTDGQAGLGADFSALAHHKLRRNGVFATVLPLTAAHADSWEGFRATVEREYDAITAIAFPADEGAMMSADTYMNEMLLIASKRNDNAGSESLGPGARLTCVNLHHPPESAIAASWYAKWIGAIQQSERSSDVIREGGRTVGNWIRIGSPKPGFPWFAVGMLNYHLASATAALMDSRLHSIAEEMDWRFSLKFTTLEQVVEIGPTHHLIGHIKGAGEKLGAFVFDPVQKGEIATYPSLWAANSKQQQEIMVAPTHEGTPVGPTANAPMLAQKGDLFISRTLRMTSQALAAARTAKPALGGRAWTALLADDAGVKAALSIWLNSTPAMMLRTAYAQTTQQGRATMQIKALSGFPVPDFAANSDAGKHARQLALEQIDDLSVLKLRPFSYALHDRKRVRIDEIALAMLGLSGDDAALRALSDLREQWCREPSVHGGSPSIMRLLGITE